MGEDATSHFQGFPPVEFKTTEKANKVELSKKQMKRKRQKIQIMIQIKHITNTHGHTQLQCNIIDV